MALRKSMLQTTSLEFDEVIGNCQSLFTHKMQDYGVAWRVMRPSSITDQLFIKVNRIRTLQISKKQMVDENVTDEFIALVNYSVIGLIQLEMGISDNLDYKAFQILEKYTYYIKKAKELMQRKNHDYGEAWREMRISSITDLIYQKILRTKQIEDNSGKTLVSEGIDANYYDIMIYAVFCLIKFKNEL